LLEGAETPCVRNRKLLGCGGEECRWDHHVWIGISLATAIRYTRLEMDCI
jgi:hypothetical protein